ncbi:MAG: N-acetylglucosamine-6-phosphate deacetylase [Caldilineaceae bacterium]|nr:N-acetylglucosamine-6-phosphate deacetylase [Caldilineaceae bacterium]
MTASQCLLISNARVPQNALASASATAEVAIPEYATVDITVTNGRIEQIVTAGQAPMSLQRDTTVLDADGSLVLPGFIDVHVHGGAGHDTMDATPAALAEMARFFAQHGVTAFLPTTITAPHGEICRALANVAACRAEPATGARLLGVHVEGPYISPHFPGAQPVRSIRPPNVQEFTELVAAGPVRMITVAPEEEGADALVALARQRDVVAVWGHTNATYEQCVAAAEKGFTQATHTYNAMSGLHHRKPGVLGATLTIDSIYAQLIADNIHVHPAAMQVLARCKGIDRTILITDAMRATGLPDGDYDLGGQTVTVADGACRLADGTLAGSILTMDRALRNFMAATGLSLVDTWPATSRTPAQSLGIGHEVGMIAVGYRGDLAVLDEELRVVQTVIGGEIHKR